MKLVMLFVFLVLCISKHSCCMDNSCKKIDDHPIGNTIRSASMPNLYRKTNKIIKSYERGLPIAATPKENYYINHEEIKKIKEKEKNSNEKRVCKTKSNSDSQLEQMKYIYLFQKKLEESPPPFEIAHSPKNQQRKKSKDFHNKD